VDILAKIQCFPQASHPRVVRSFECSPNIHPAGLLAPPNVRKAHVGSFFANAKLNLVNPPALRFTHLNIQWIFIKESFAHVKISNATAKPQISLFRAAKNYRQHVDFEFCLRV